MANIAQWTCPTCNALVATPFCPICGESPLHAHALTLRSLFGHMFAAFTSIDSRLVRSFRYLVSRPGVLTVAYLEGRRKPYLGPVRLFLIANILFFAVESLSGGTIFTAPLDSHLHTQPWDVLAQQLVAHRLEALNTTLALYAPGFDQALAVNARSLIILATLGFAFAPALVFIRGRHPLIAHAVFSLHFFAFLLLLLCVATAVPPIDSLIGGTGFSSQSLDYVLIGVLLATSAVYLYIATGAVYGARGVMRVLKSAALTAAVFFVLLAYRFVLLLITLYTT
jgi:hypothetical protein